MSSRTSLVLGAQWGDEGKGRIVDHRAKNTDVVVRYHGGGNAGHTIKIGETETVLHLLPSGIMRRGMMNLVGPGVVCDPEVLVAELDIARRSGATVYMDRSAPVVLPIHKLLDGAREGAKSGAIGTTKRGIGPTYEDLASRRAMKLGDLTSRRRAKETLTAQGYYEERCALARHYECDPMTLDQTLDWCMRFSDEIVPYLADTRALVAELEHGGARILFEGAQGVLLDVLHGSQPFCTSSSCTAGGASATFGVYAFDRVTGVAKAYMTRVGAGPFPTELLDASGEALREAGREFGSTTGRPRRCGWLDLVALRYACRMGGVTDLVITKLDVLRGFDPLFICTGYIFEGRPLGPFETLTSRVLHEAVPIYTRMPGWFEDITACRSFHDLPTSANDYVRYVEKFVGIKVLGVSVGPEREQFVT